MARQARLNWLLFVPMSALLLAGGLWGYRAIAIRRAEASIEEHRSEKLRLEACAIERPVATAPHPWGAENAWDLFLPALKRLVPTRDDLHEQILQRDNAPEHPLELHRRAQAIFPDLRKAAARTNWTWVGPLDVDLISKAELAAWLLSGEAQDAVQKRRFDDVFDDLFAALRLMQEAVRIKPTFSRDALHEIEQRVCETAQRALAEHAYPAELLRGLESRLDRLRAERPAPLAAMPYWNLEIARWILEEQPEGFEPAGWRHVWSESVRVAGRLNDARDGFRVLEAVSWRSSADLAAYWPDESSNGIPVEPGRYWTLSTGFRNEFRALVRLDCFRAALAVSRFEAVSGRLPADLAEAGVGSLLPRPLSIEPLLLHLSLSDPDPRPADPLHTWPLAPR